MAVDTTILSPELLRPFTAAQARDIGITAWQLRVLLSEAVVRHVLHDVYIAGDVPDTIDVRLAALALVTPPHAVVCDRTAAWVWGVDAFQPWELDMVPPLDTYVLRGRTRIRRPEAAGGERDLSAEDVVTVGGIEVTTPLRTSLDLATGLSRNQALAVMESFARMHGVGKTQLRALLPRYRGRRGVVQARELIPLVDPRTESTGESFVKLAIHDAGLPQPQPQHWVSAGGAAAYRLDLAYPRLKICIEYDGEEFHSSDEAKEKDRRRRNWLREHGWVVIVVTKDDLRGARREAWLAELRVAIVDRMR